MPLTARQIDVSIRILKSRVRALEDEIRAVTSLYEALRVEFGGDQ